MTEEYHDISAAFLRELWEYGLLSFLWKDQDNYQLDFLEKTNNWEYSETKVGDKQKGAPNRKAFTWKYGPISSPKYRIAIASSTLKINRAAYALS